MIRGTITMTFSFQDMDPPTSVRVAGKGGGLQSSADLVIVLHLTQDGGRTLVAWSADLIVGGLVASIGSKLLQSTTESKIREIVEGIRGKVR